MSEEIVACSGCGKKFRIPEGSPASGKFACTACEADVAWGAAAKSSGGGRRGKSGGSSRKGRGSSARGASAKKSGGAKAGASSRGARRARGRKGHDEPDVAQDEAGERRGRGAPKPKENKTVPIVIAIMGAVLLAGGLIVAFTGDPPDYEKQADARIGVTPTSGSVGGLSSSGTPEPVAVKPDPAPAPVAPTTVPEAGTDEAEPTTEPGDDSGIGSARTGAADGKGYRYWYLRPASEIFIPIPPIEGTTEEEIAELTRLAGLATDFDSGNQGMSAERALSKVGRKAIPFLLSRLAEQYNGEKWTVQGEQFGAGKIQQLCREITKKDGPPSPFYARFSPQGAVPPEHYQRAGKMWIAWWMGEGRYIEEFANYEDEE